LVVDDEDARPRRAGSRTRGRRGGRCRARTAAARTLAVEPRVDVALAEAPLPADADGGNLARLDQTVDRPQGDVQVLENFFSREKGFVNHALFRAGGGAVGSSTVKMAPPSG